jgi:hypothetical protein
MPETKKADIRWKWLEMEPPHGIMFKPVETNCGGMKTAPSENCQKSCAIAHRRIKMVPIGAWNKNARFRWKLLEIAPRHRIMFKRVETGRGGMKTAPGENGQNSCVIACGRLKMIFIKFPTT